MDRALPQRAARRELKGGVDRDRQADQRAPVEMRVGSSFNPAIRLAASLIQGACRSANKATEPAALPVHARSPRMHPTRRPGSPSPRGCQALARRKLTERERPVLGIGRMWDAA